MVNFLVLNPPLGPEKFPTLKYLSTNDIVKIWASACYSLRIELLRKNVSLASCSSTGPGRPSGALTPTSVAPTPTTAFSPPQRAQETGGLRDPARLTRQAEKHACAEELATVHSLEKKWEKKAVSIGIGTFAVVKDHVSVGKDEALIVQRPLFQVCRFLKRFYQLKYAQKDIPDEIPVVQLNYEHIAKDTGFLSEAVQHCIEETLLFFSGALAEGKEVELVFKDIGILAVRRQVVTMNFFDHCLMEVDSTGNMMPALLAESEMTDVVTFDTRNDFPRFSHDGVIVLPRFALEFPGKSSLHARSVKPRQEVVPGEPHNRKVSLLDPVLLAQRRISLAKLALKESEDFKGIGGGQGRFLPSIPERSSKADKQPKPQAQLKSELPACAHQPSGKGVCYLCTDPAKRRLHLLMTSKRREIEGEIWGEYYANKTKERLLQGQTTCRYVSEDPKPPSHVLRKEYDEKLKEGMKEQDPKKGIRRASEGREALCLPEDLCWPEARPDLKLLETYKALQGERARKAALNRDTVKQEFICKGEKKPLFDRREMAHALPATPRSRKLTP